MTDLPTDADLAKLQELAGAVRGKMAVRDVLRRKSEEAKAAAAEAAGHASQAGRELEEAQHALWDFVEKGLSV